MSAWVYVCVAWVSVCVCECVCEFLSVCTSYNGDKRSMIAKGLNKTATCGCVKQITTDDEKYDHALFTKKWSPSKFYFDKTMV